MQIFQTDIEAERHAALARQKILHVSDFQTLLASAEGRRFLRRLLAECGVYRGSFTGDALTSAFQEGRRSVGLWLMGLLAAFPEEYLQLLREQGLDEAGE